MQSNQFKIISLFLVLIFTTTITAFGQIFSRDIEVADSLFEQKKFTESFEIYKAIYETGEYASSAMLLKMAYIREGLGDEGGALYYLNTYYLHTANDRVFTKMEELANQSDLKGYEYSGQGWFFNLYYKYYYHLLMILAVLIMSLFLVILYKRIKQRKRTYLAGFGLLTMITLLFLIVNWGAGYKQGILIKENSYIMSAPSASADVIDVTKAGHRVKILGQEDIWMRIQWDNQVGYIKNSYVKQLFF